MDTLHRDTLLQEFLPLKSLYVSFSAIDTNVIVALWDADERDHLTALDLLDEAGSRGGVVICGAVFGELLAGPGRTEEFVNKFLLESEIVVDWSSTEAIWRTAGSAFQKYAKRRRRTQVGDPRRILTDFYTPRA